ncbi:RNA polymerase sigma-54 factor [Hoeflea phototrophica DFL-43]|uniref:RNA polymerase sigma-54 factor n=1 Tax=Hoeflea phototrophica (strain DSM 17068 / NCIMB 14078 / DFL-43) TaxID=411684 RepID=A9CX72_HOEPD|nr:RNA polymerase factor sigma-54 [Hoeflea phototrophica]EDQ35621.1 RNA polymerase sigma-54 factor [Hoeflea phototrophica DFL-43]
MALSASLQLRQSQSLVMTPQLMQSIRLLQFSHIELNRFIEQEVERNPLLELVTPESEANNEGANGDGSETSRDHSAQDSQSGASSSEGGEGADGLWAASSETSTERLNEEIDGRYENVFPDDHGVEKPSAPEFVDNWKSMPGNDGGQGGEGYDLDDFAARAPTLRDHVAEQIAFTFADPAERLIATDIADQLDAAGYIAGDLLETIERLSIDQAKLEHVLGRLQEFEPAGLFARSLSECLALQLDRKNRLDPAMAALVNNLELLARRDFSTLKRLCGVDEEDLLDMLAEIRALDPKPGTRFETGSSELIVPDVSVKPGADGGWVVELNSETLPRVLVNQSYFATVSSQMAKNTPGQEFLSECMQTANWLVRSLDQRARTITKVASEIVRQQDAFLLHGVDHLRPLNLKAVADAIGMHESTVSRVTSNKYMITPRGVFELKYFFTVSIASAEAGGDAHSAESVRHRIKALIDEELPDSVLSDDDLVTLLKQSGVEIARRTVAKYREAMSIPSSVQRRREKRARARAAAV